MARVLPVKKGDTKKMKHFMMKRSTLRQSLLKKKSFKFYVIAKAHCEGNNEKSIPSRGFITIAIGVHPST